MAIIILLLLLGFVLLIKGADFMVKGASSLAKKFDVSELVIGLTIVAFGTSAPELIVSVVSSSKGLNEVAFGNVIGSNIFNLYFILGVAGIIYPIVVEKSIIKKEIPFSLFAALLLLVLTNDDFLWGKGNVLDRLDAIILLVFFTFFIIYVFKNQKKEVQLSPQPDAIPTKDKKQPLAILIVMIVGGLAGLIIGGQLVVDNAVLIARNFNLSDKLIGLTIVAAGTSLPELATSAVAAFKKNSDIAIGNVVGSNIFNILFILAVSGLMAPIDYNSILNTDVYVLAGGTVLLAILFLGKSQKLSRLEAALLLAGYIGYVYYLIWRE